MQQNTPFKFADILEEYVNRASYTPGQMARLSGIPQATIVNWLEGRVKKPRQRDSLLKLAQILHLNESEASALLQAAGHPSIEELLLLANEKEKKLLSSWSNIVQQRRQAPFQAITDLPYFVGREKELQILRNALLNGRNIAICSLQGMGGVGKTTLAARAAYLLRPHFPDGVLWAQVRNSDTMSILSAFANAYNRDVSPYQDIDSRSQVVRELLAHKRTLIILDDVCDSETARPLLPPSGNCAVIITTRCHNLSVTTGVSRLFVGEFDKSKHESIILFSKILGEEHVQENEQVFSEVADSVGHLPLAVDIVASRLAYEPGWSAADFLKRLQKEKGKLKELSYDDHDVRLSFNLSYQALPAPQQQFFAALGVFGGEDFSIEAVAYITQLPLDEAHDDLRQLYALSLVQEGRFRRYRLHPLLWDYAHHKLEDPATYQRMVYYFITYVNQHETDYEAIDLEYNNIVTALATAVSQQMTSAIIQGSNTLFHYLNLRGLFSQAQHHLNHALIAAQDTDDTINLMLTLRHLGQVARSLGLFEQAQTYIEQALQLEQHQAYPQELSALLTELATIHGLRGNYQQAETCLHQSLPIARQANNAYILAATLKALGIINLKRGRLNEAEDYLQEGLTLAQTIEDQEQTSTMLINLGVLAIERKAYNIAEDYCQRALIIHRQIGKRVGISVSLSNLSNIALLKEEYQQAETYLQEALTLAYEVQDQTTIGILLWRLGRVACQQAQYEIAQTYFEDSLELACEIGHRENEMQNFAELALLACHLNNPIKANNYLQECLQLANQLERPRFREEILNRWHKSCHAHKNGQFAYQIDTV